MNTWMQWVILFWSLTMITFVAIGGFFMFRKFLRVLPKKNGLSEEMRREAMIEQSLSLWNEEGKALLNELVRPVPSLFREAAKKAIAAKIAEIALARHVTSIDEKMILEGYILATPRQDHRFLWKHVERLGLDVSEFEDLIKRDAPVRKMRQA